MKTLLITVVAATVLLAGCSVADDPDKKELKAFDLVLDKIGVWSICGAAEDGYTAFARGADTGALMAGDEGAARCAALINKHIGEMERARPGCGYAFAKIIPYLNAARDNAFGYRAFSKAGVSGMADDYANNRQQAFDHLMASYEQDCRAPRPSVRKPQTVSTPSTRQPDSPVATAPPPPVFSRPVENLSVVGVAFDDVLNVRSAPRPDADIVAKLKPDGLYSISRTGQATRVGSQTWMEIKVEGATGWVNARYLSDKVQSPLPPPGNPSNATPAASIPLNTGDHSLASIAPAPQPKAVDAESDEPTPDVLHPDGESGGKQRIATSVEDIIKSQLVTKGCFADHSDMVDAKRLRATIRVWFGRNGQFAQPYQLVTPSREPFNDPPLQAFITHARRALDMCNRLGWQIPEEYFRLSQPQYVDVTFVAKIGAGQ